MSDGGVELFRLNKIVFSESDIVFWSRENVFVSLLYDIHLFWRHFDFPILFIGVFSIVSEWIVGMLSDDR